MRSDKTTCIKVMSTRSSALNNIWMVAGLALFFYAGMVCAGSNIYVYQAKDGTRSITDRIEITPGYRLIKTYRTGASRLIATTNTGSGVKPDYWQPTPMSSRYDGIISSTASQFGVDRALVKAMVQVESSYNPNAVSKKGAYGLMQLMPATARRYGVKDRSSPTENLRGGVRYLRDLLEMFDQDTRLAVAAYNAGEHNVIRYNGVPPYRETINYVKKVTTLRQIYTQ